MKTSLTKQDLRRYASSGHLPRGLHNLILSWHYAAFKRLQRMKNGN